MAKSLTRWEKVRMHLEQGGWGSAEKLGKATELGARNIRRWLDGQPVTNEVEVLSRIAAEFGEPWSVLYLIDESQGYPPLPRHPAIEAATKLLPERFRPLVVACSDERKADWLLAQLALYDRAARPGRRGS